MLAQGTGYLQEVCPQGGRTNRPDVRPTPCGQGSTGHLQHRMGMTEYGVDGRLVRGVQDFALSFFLIEDH